MFTSFINNHKQSNITKPKRSLSLLLVGNPNVGKSTLFNCLTGQNQHTGNWTGKTVESAKGYFNNKDYRFDITDLPGAYSLNSFSPEEQVACDVIKNSKYDAVIIVANATALERNLLLALQVLMHTQKAVLCLNMIDEAENKHISIDTEELSLQLGIPVVTTVAKKKKNLSKLINTATEVITGSQKTYKLQKLDSIINSRMSYVDLVQKLSELASEIAEHSVSTNTTPYTQKDIFLDKLFTSRITGIPVMLLLFSLVFWLTACGANYPGTLLTQLFDVIISFVITVLEHIKLPTNLISLISDGMLTTTAWVVSVMLPPALIFFPLFAIMEESGYLPRIAFNLDRLFSKAGINGKVSITMLMGFGCNACGVMGCRTIHSKKERFIATVTNSFIPCNGRLPTLICLCSIFFMPVASGVLNSILTTIMLLCLLILSVVMTLIVSTLITKLKVDNTSSGFFLELPPYRKPQFFKTIIYSLKNKVLFVLSRAVLVSLPAGAIIWLLANTKINNIPPLIYITDFLNPFGLLLGLDGVILTAFILGFPANEIVIPIILMAYMNNGTLTDYTSISQLGEILQSNGWTITTAISCCVFCLFHFPCSTTCFAIKKETDSYKWTLMSILIPLITGTTLCMIISLVSTVF